MSNNIRKIILKQRQSPGDILTMTRAIADLKMAHPNWLIDVRSPCPEIFYNNPFLNPLDEKDSDVEQFDVQYNDINISGWNGLHFTDAFRHDLEQQLGVPIPKTSYRPDLFISDEEKQSESLVKKLFMWDGPYWIINGGCKPDNHLKQYHRWEETAELLNEYFGDKIKLVQVGHDSHEHPKIKGALNLIGKTNLRELILTCFFAHGVLTPLSFPFVVSAALEQPCVVVAGGREGVPWHLYPHVRYLYSNGALNCCTWDGCWICGEMSKCKNLTEKNVPLCYEIIKPHMIVDAVKMYYEGGRLQFPN